MKLSLPALIAAAAAATLSLPAAAHDAPMAKAAEPAVIATKLADARAAQRDLWIGHVFWLLNVVLPTFHLHRQAATAAERSEYVTVFAKPCTKSAGQLWRIAARSPPLPPRRRYRATGRTTRTNLRIGYTVFAPQSR